MRGAASGPPGWGDGNTRTAAPPLLHSAAAALGHCCTVPLLHSTPTTQPAPQPSPPPRSASTDTFRLAFDPGRWDPKGALTPKQFPVPACTAPGVQPELTLSFKGNGPWDGARTGHGVAGLGGCTSTRMPALRACQVRARAHATASTHPRLLPKFSAWDLDLSGMVLELSHMPDETSLWDEKTGSVRAACKREGWAQAGRPALHCLCRLHHCTPITAPGSPATPQVLAFFSRRQFKPCTGGISRFARTATAVQRTFKLCPVTGAKALAASAGPVQLTALAQLP